MNDLIKIVEFSEFDKQLAEFKDRYENVVYNLDDPTQNKQARSDNPFQNLFRHRMACRMGAGASKHYQSDS